MAQQINLYPQGRDRRQQVFSRAGSLVVLLALAAAVAFWAHIETQRLAGLKAEIARTGAERERLQRLLAQVPSPAASQAERVAAEEKDVAAIEQVAARLSAGALGTNDGFAAKLKAFARTPVDGVWLTQIRIDHTAGSLSVEGRALDAAQVPAWISGLRRDPLLAQVTFAALELRATDERAPGAAGVQFRLRSVAGREAPAPAGGAATATLASAVAR